jgi:hypothetical protein
MHHAGLPLLCNAKGKDHTLMGMYRAIDAPLRFQYVMLMTTYVLKPWSAITALSGGYSLVGMGYVTACAVLPVTCSLRTQRRVLDFVVKVFPCSIIM